jgi:hypothetical protein
MFAHRMKSCSRNAIFVSFECQQWLSNCLSNVLTCATTTFLPLQCPQSSR